MTNIEFLTRKNEIIKDVTGRTLVPEDQIVELKHLPELTVDSGCGEELGTHICTYCAIFYGDEFNATDVNCTGCPMKEAGNRCNDKDSSWRKLKVIWEDNAKDEDVEKLRDLVIQYNDERVHALTNDEIFELHMEGETVIDNSY